MKGLTYSINLQLGPCYENLFRHNHVITMLFQTYMKMLLLRDRTLHRHHCSITPDHLFILAHAILDR